MAALPALLRRIPDISGGPELVVVAARLYVRSGRKTLAENWSDYNHKSERATIVTLANAAGPAAHAEEEAQLEQQLRQLPQQVLKQLIPFARHHRRLLARLAGLEQAIPLIELMIVMSQRDVPGRSWHDVFANSSDPTSGVLDVAAARAVLGQSDEKQISEILALFRPALAGMSNLALLLHAVMGWNREQVRKKIVKRNQPAVKAYGLLPLERGQDEVLERYLWLRQFAHESKQFGPQRQPNERAAVQAALANLAQVSGYGDATRLELAMESRLVEKVEASGHSWQLGDYRLELMLTDDGSELVVRRGEKTLASVPPAVRKHPDYAAVKETVAQFRTQASRCRTALETWMSNGETLTRNELLSLCHLPAARSMLARLVLLQEGEHGLQSGLFDAESQTLIGLDGQHYPLCESVRIAHAYHLIQANLLEGWQREIVHRRVVQPFKQVYREAYLLTPAEEETNTFSRRFAGHQVDSRIATRLFQSRNWQIPESHGDDVIKVVASGRLRAIFNFADIGNHFIAFDSNTTSYITFLPNDAANRDRRYDQLHHAVPLSEVPPLVFSEVMRDADLIVSIAGAGDGEHYFSAEVAAQRGTVITTLLAELGLPGVRVEGDYAHVQGKLASYRVHLGSGSIHLEPGNYLCIVPAPRTEKGDALYLPFADEGDRKMREILSKILLLLRDDKIKDESILRQIRRNQAA
ncbi:MAG: DUF4132 domain-containing protein [Chloroflexaceae bacterium]|nr:DUF4132 domain-containing protein [Chloroflexaceae bacterium]